MSLSEEQKNTVAKWFAGGEGVAEIQKHISSEFGIDLTYLDVRWLVADLPQPERSTNAAAKIRHKNFFFMKILSTI